MKRRFAFILVVAGSLSLGGCPLLIDGVNNLLSRDLSLRDVASGLDFPNIPSGAIRVEVINQSGSLAETRITMRVGGRRVHLSTRRVQPTSQAVIVGPDRADSVLFEASVFSNPARVVTPETRILGRDFSSGQTVQFIIPALPERDCNANGIDDSSEPDSDGDGTIDACDACPQDVAKIALGTCGCGVPDLDSDHDGALNCLDACPSDPLKTAPGPCGCGVPEVDTDFDGIADCVDPCVGLSKDPNFGNLDSDQDGVFDCLDGCPTDPNKSNPGACGCGNADLDTNGNGVADCNEVQNLSVAILDLDSNIRVNNGTAVLFRLRLSNFTSGAIIRTFAKAVGGQDEIQIETTPAPADLVDVSWHVEGLLPGAYEVFAEVIDGARTAVAGPSIGKVLVNDQPVLIFDSPTPNLLVSRRLGFTIGWAGADSDDNAAISLFLDIDQERNGNELLLRENVAEDDQNDREFFVDPLGLGLAVGDYYIGGVISDPLTVVPTYAGRVCLTDDLVGRIDHDDLALNTTTRILGTLNNFNFGHSVDISRDITGDEKADVLVGDPLARRTVQGNFVDTGAAYFFATQPAGFPALLNVNQASRTYRGSQISGLVGARVALPVIGTDRGDLPPYVLIGAPQVDGVRSMQNGRVFYAPISVSRDVVDLCCIENIGGSSVRGEEPLDFLGQDVAVLGDVTGDGHPDYAFGASRQTSEGQGYVAIVDARHFPPTTAIGNIAFLLFEGTPGGLFGNCIRPVPDLDGDEIDEFVIGEPLGLSSAGPSGVVHLVFGTPDLDADNRSLGSDIRIHRFVGATDGERAGFAVAVGDFDCDEKTDLLIGAPNYNNASGRVYLVSDVGRSSLPDEVRLADVGTAAVPGAILDGVSPGDFLGHALASVPDFNGDGQADFAVGAPTAEDQRGVARLLYACNTLRGRHAIGPFNCDIRGFELPGLIDGIGRLGSALSSGDVNGDGLFDLAIGSAGIDSDSGEVLIIYGRNADD